MGHGAASGPEVHLQAGRDSASAGVWALRHAHRVHPPSDGGPLRLPTRPAPPLVGLTQPHTRSPAHSVTPSISHTLAHPLTQSLPQSVTHSLTRSLSHSLNQSHTRSLSHTLSLNCAPTQSRTESVTHLLARERAFTLILYVYIHFIY